MLLLPFFVSFVIRSLAWQFLLSDNGILLGTLKNLHLLPQNFHVLATSTAVILGIAYNYLPFTALPLYVSLERIDTRVIEAAGDLYANKLAVFRRVVFPLSDPRHLRRVPAHVRAGGGRLPEPADPGRRLEHR